MDAYTRIFTLERADEAELFHCMQEAAGEDADRRGGGMDALFAKGLRGCCCGNALTLCADRRRGSSSA